MRVLTREWFGVSRPDVFRLIPIGDVHIGAAACDEDKVRRVVKRIEDDRHCYWFGMGDYADFINTSDPRFSYDALAPWMIRASHLSDIAAAQRNRFLDIIEPIAYKCLGLVAGNHETAIRRHYERDIYHEIVSGVKERGEFDPDDKLAFGYAGFLLLKFYRHVDRRRRVRRITLSLHHGFVGGKLAGAKALNMQRWLWSHECDVAVFGHSHNISGQAEAVLAVDRNGNLVHHVRQGVFAGSFLRGEIEGASTYSEVKGYFPAPTGGVVISLRPGAKEQEDRISIATRGLS